jgi:hypothetical protein
VQGKWGVDLSSDDSPPSAPAGWYVNPSGSGQRYWDGEQWTDSYSGAGPPPPSSVVADRSAEDGSGNMGLVFAGYLLAVVIPLAGFILGIVAATRPEKRISKHGVWIVVVSLVVTALYLVVVLHSGRSTESASLRL